MSDHHTLAPSPDAFLAEATAAYTRYMTCTDDWDIFEACETSVREQRAFSGNNELVRTLTYGELDLQALGMLIYILKFKFGLRDGGIFYDLGSGTGKAVIAAATMHSFSKCCGIELLNGLHTVALYHKAIWDGDTCFNHRPAVLFFQGSILDRSPTTGRSWSDGDVVFANSHCFSHDMMIDLSDMAGQLKVGSYFITTTMELDKDTSGFRELDRCSVSMSWGTAEAIIYRKETRGHIHTTMEVIPK